MKIKIKHRPLDFLISNSFLWNLVFLDAVESLILAHVSIN